MRQQVFDALAALDEMGPPGECESVSPDEIPRSSSAPPPSPADGLGLAPHRVGQNHRQADEQQGASNHGIEPVADRDHAAKEPSEDRECKAAVIDEQANQLPPGRLEST